MTAAALGVACFGLLALTPSAAAKADPVEIYDATGQGQGIVATFSVKPSIFDPLVQAGLLYAQSDIASRGGGTAFSLSSGVFPGRFAVGAVGCGGLPGSQHVQAHYPASGNCQQQVDFQPIGPVRSTFFTDQGLPQADAAINALAANVAPEVSHLRTTADRGLSDSFVITGSYRIGDAAAPVLEVGQSAIYSHTELRRDGILTHDVLVEIHGLKLFAGLITIDKVTTRARTESDGITGTPTATLKFTNALAHIGEDTVSITITPDGIEGSDPRFDREQNLRFGEALTEDLLRAGLAVRAATPVKLSGPGSADASVGGLIVTAQGTVPSARVPSELTPVLSEVIKRLPTPCAHDTRRELVGIHKQFGSIPEVPLCFGAGAAPGPNSKTVLTLSIATAQSALVGAPGYAASTTGGTTGGSSTTGFLTTGGTTGGTKVLGNHFQAPPPATGGTTGSIVIDQPRPVAFGLVARLPAVALAWLGAMLLVLALGLGFGPSLRRAGAS